MQRMTGGAYLTNAERLKEIADTITAATIARRYAATDWEREKINESIERASAEKYRILGISTDQRTAETGRTHKHGRR